MSSVRGALISPAFLEKEELIQQPLCVGWGWGTRGSCHCALCPLSLPEKSKPLCEKEGGAFTAQQESSFLVVEFKMWF